MIGELFCEALLPVSKLHRDLGRNKVTCHVTMIAQEKSLVK